jgi:uncharacterized protein YidB (DUF937 family)
MDSSLGSLLSKLGGGNQGQSSMMLMTALGLLQQHGGLSAVLDKFRQNGMSEHVDSWVGNGPNMSVSPDQIQQVFGHSSIANAASQIGQSHSQTSSMLSSILPELINHFTPQGQVPANHSDLLSQAMSMLRGNAATTPSEIRPVA